MIYIETNKIKKIAYDLGADLCGIASIDRFEEAPEGFHPCDVLSQCKSVVVIAKAFPTGTVHCKTTVPYTITRNMLSDMLDKLSVQFCIEMERHGVAAVPAGTISHTQFDTKSNRFRGIVSAKHCAVAAGLGRIGRNTLVTTPEYGNMLWLSVVLTDIELEPDEILTGDPCPEGCSLCIDNCPVGALGDPEMNQRACLGHAFHTEQGQEFTFKCYKCRTICPNCFGTKNKLTNLNTGG